MATEIGSVYSSGDWEKWDLNIDDKETQERIYADGPKDWKHEQVDNRLSSGYISVGLCFRPPI